MYSKYAADNISTLKVIIMHTDCCCLVFFLNARLNTVSND